MVPAEGRAFIAVWEGDAGERRLRIPVAEEAEVILAPGCEAGLSRLREGHRLRIVFGDDRRTAVRVVASGRRLGGRRGLRLLSVHPETREVVLAAGDAGRPRRFPLEEDACLLDGERPVELDALRAGRRARVFLSAEGESVAGLRVLRDEDREGDGGREREEREDDEERRDPERDGDGEG